MKRGYQIIEPSALQPLFSSPLYDVFAVAMMTWLCDLLRLELQDHLQQVDFEVICVTYLGSYPAIGIHYKDEDYQDVGPLAETVIERILREKSALEFARFIAERGINWQQITTTTLSKKEVSF